jgi:hypothetical protein
MRPIPIQITTTTAPMPGRSAAISVVAIAGNPTKVIGAAKTTVQNLVDIAILLSN